MSLFFILNTKLISNFILINLAIMDTKSLIQLPGYRYNEYLLVLNPHEELRNKIYTIKNEFADK